MKRPPKPPTFHFEFRDDQAGYVSAWLIAKNYAACSGLLHGTMTAENAKFLVDAMTAAGFECRWKVSAGPDAAGDERKVERQRSLFEEQS